MNRDGPPPPMGPRTRTAPSGSSRREFLGTALVAAGLMVPRGVEASDPGSADPGSAVMTAAASSRNGGNTGKTSIVCIIRYEIDPYQRDAFKEYAARWGPIIPRCGGSLIGYFLPWQGTNYIGWGLIGAFDSLSAYERYQTRLRQDPDARANFKFAADRRFIVHEERNFVEVVAGTLERPATV